MRLLRILETTATICFSLAFWSVPTFATNSGVTYQGRIVKPDGSPLSGTNTQFKMQIRTPDSQACLMYEEIQSENLSGSNGSFSITINDGTGSRTDSTALTLDQVFANHGSFTFDVSTCSSGTGTYAPNSSDGRALVVLFKDETMSTWEPIPAQRVNFVPFAFEAKQVAGFTSKSLVRVAEADGTLDLVSPLSNAQYTALLGLANGTSTSYTPSGQLNGVALPTMTSGQVLGWNGTTWVSTSPLPTANSVTSSMLQTSSVTTNAIANNVSINTSGTLGSAVTTTRSFTIYPASPNNNGITFLASSSMATPYALTWPLNAGAANQVLTTDGSGGLTWAAPAASSQWTTHGSNISFDGGGNVGIGTTSPSHKIEIVTTGATGADGILLSNVDSGYGVQIQPASPALNFNMRWNGSAFKAIGPDFTGSVQLAPSSGDLYLVTGSNPGAGNSVAAAIRMDIKNNGRVGIGTTSPTDFVDVRGPLEATGGLHVNTYYDSSASAWKQVTTGYGGTVSVNSSGAMIFTNAPASAASDAVNTQYERMRIGTNGNVGIGSTSPTAALHLKAGTSSAGTAPLKLTVGPLMTTPEDGAIEYASSDLYFTIGSTRYVIPTNSAAGSYSNVSSISNPGGSITLSPAASSGTVYVNSGTISTGTSSGALTVSGGAGVSGDIFAGATINAGTSVSAATSVITPQIYGSTAASGNIKIDGTSNATKGNVLLATAGGNVGIGTTSPADPLSILNTSNAAVTVSNGLSVTNNSTGASNHNGALITEYNHGSSPTTENGLSVISTNDYGFVTTQNGLLATTNVASSSTYSNAGNFILNVGGGTAATGVRSTIANTGSSTNVYGFYTTVSNTSAITNSYGLYVDAVAGTNRYGVYENSGGKNYFAGNVGIGTTAPAGTLDVRGGTAAASMNGTDVNIIAQNAGSGANNGGGNINLTAGNAYGTATGSSAGNVVLTGGSSVSTAGGGGGIIIRGGTAAAGNTPGGVSISGGTANSSVGAGVTLLGSAGGSGNNAGGAISISGGAGSGSGTGGGVAMSASAGGATGTGGDVTIKSGAGGSTSGNSGSIGLTVGSITSGVAGVFKLMGGNVGIGTTSPTSVLDVTVAAGGGSMAVTSLVDSSKYGYSEYGFQLKNPSAATQVQALYSLGSEGNYSNSGAVSNQDFYIFDQMTAQYKFAINGPGDVQIGGNISDTSTGAGSKLIIKASGNVGIGTTAPGQTLDVAGNIKTSGCLYYASSSLGTCASDERIKKDVRPFELGLDTIRGLKPVRFKYNGLAGFEVDNKDQLGFIAQDVERVAPSLVKTQMVTLRPSDTSKTQIKVVDYSSFAYVTINAVKELYQKWFDDSAAIHLELASVKSENEALKKQVQQYEQQAAKSDRESSAIKTYLCAKDGKAPFCP